MELAMIRYLSTEGDGEVVDRKYPRDVIEYLPKGVRTNGNNIALGIDDDVNAIPFWLLFNCAIIPGSISIETVNNDAIEPDTIMLGLVTEETYWKYHEFDEGLMDKKRKYCVIQWQHKWNKMYNEMYIIRYQIYSDANGTINPITRELMYDVELVSNRLHDTEPYNARLGI